MLVGSGLASVALTAAGVLGTFAAVVLAADAWGAASRFVGAHLASLDSRVSLRGRYLRWLERRAGTGPAGLQRNAALLQGITRAVGGLLAVGFAFLLVSGVTGLAGVSL